MKTALVYFVLNKSRIDPTLGVDEWYVGRKYNPTILTDKNNYTIVVRS